MRWRRHKDVVIDGQAKRYYLSHSEFFRDIDMKAIDALVPSVPMEQVSKGHTFFLPGDQVEGLFIIKKGRVKLYRIASDGRVLTVAILGYGDVFGKMSVLGLASSGTGAEVLADALVCIMPNRVAREFILGYPKAGLRLLEQMETRLEEMETRLEDFTFGTVATRLAKLLLQLDQEQTNSIADFTHQEMADILGVYRETVSQTLGTLRAAGIIELKRKCISILDREKLQSLAESRE
ncbi:MAG: cyclic nucleotide-binding protein [Actinobacteria bacterium HGW-Actinobacteria-7]|jgi:CRP-like cAMP-binding protein|nr:MAG: cyclic nucleotide-binding protein [Actinobacteria bacterium HGW-Actinobacteria-7]